MKTPVTISSRDDRCYGDMLSLQTAGPQDSRPIGGGLEGGVARTSPEEEYATMVNTTAKRPFFDRHKAGLEEGIEWARGERALPTASIVARDQDGNAIAAAHGGGEVVPCDEPSVTKTA